MIQNGSAMENSLNCHVCYTVLKVSINQSILSVLKNWIMNIFRMNHYVKYMLDWSFVFLMVNVRMRKQLEKSNYITNFGCVTFSIAVDLQH